MISLDISILYQMVIFLVLWLILRPVLFRPYMGLLEEREHETIGAAIDTSQLERQGAQLKAEYEEKIAQARGAGAAAKEAIVLAARQERERMLSQARDEAARMVEGVRQDVQAQLEKERALAQAEVAGVAQDMVSKILGRKVG